ncbi:MAG: alpha/beta fold hydrolase, partial [Xanthomonadales bacterium]|nr:alpha/beta fold hydrolase [Xanthomonadales bacterium]
VFLSLGQKRAGLQSKSLHVGKIRWHYLSGGRGPLLLMLHGFGGDASNWLQLARQLRHHFTLVIPDLPGFGDSELPDLLHFDVESQAWRLEAFLDALGTEQCLIAGNSMGGYLAAALAAQSPRRVAALWLLAPLGIRAVEPGYMLKRVDSGALEYLEINSTRQFRQLVLPHMFAMRRWLPSPLVRVLARRAIAMRAQSPRMLREARFESEPLETIASRVDVPVLIQWGASDEVTNPLGIDILKASFKNATCSVTPNCGHLPMLEHPAESARLLLEFVDQKALIQGRG